MGNKGHCAPSPGGFQPENGTNRPVKITVSLPGAWYVPVRMSKIVIFAFAVIATVASAADYPPPVEADFVITNFQFHSGQTLAAVRMHYLRFGNLKRDRNGVVRNAVLILHGTTGSSAETKVPRVGSAVSQPCATSSS